MGLVKFLYVIRCTSQDPVYKASNLLEIGGSEPWLCAKEDVSNQLEAEFQMDKDSYIHRIEIGNSGSSQIEIQVGLSAFPNKTRYITILPPKMLLTSGNKDDAVHVFHRKNLNNVAEARWNRIRVICSPPHKIKNKQFGIKYLLLHNMESINLNMIQERLPKEISHTLAANDALIRFSDDGADSNKRDDEEDASMFKTWLPKEISHTLAANDALIRFSDDGAYSNKIDDEEDASMSKTWLPKEISHTLAANDALIRFSDDGADSNKIDDEEDESMFTTWPPKELSPTLAANDALIRFFGDSADSNKIDDEEDASMSKTCPEKFMQLDVCQPSTSKIYVDCPLCEASFRSSEIEEHSATCRDASAYGFDDEACEFDDEACDDEDYFKCPFCQELFLGSEINFHADKCLG